MALAGVGLFTREGGFTLKQLIRTPMDWMMSAYFLYILFWSPGAVGDLWSQLCPSIGFYFLVALTLNRMSRIYTYLAWLCGAIMFIAIMALLSLVGFDPLGSAGTTAGSLGRLTPNTSLFSNPNALGHSVMVAVPLLYFFMFWNRPVFVKEVGAPLIFLPLLCTYFTQSKGAFISGAGAIVATLAFGRPKWVQLFLLPALLMLAVSAVPLLPRFSEVKFGGGQAQQDEALRDVLRPLSLANGRSKTRPTELATDSSTRPISAKKVTWKPSRRTPPTIACRASWAGGAC